LNLRPRGARRLVRGFDPFPIREGVKRTALAADDGEARTQAQRDSRERRVQLPLVGLAAERLKTEPAAMSTLCFAATHPDHGLLRAITVPMIANATNRNRTTCEPDSPPKKIAIASVPINDPPWLRIHSLRAQRYSARVLKRSGCGRPRGILD
jgi:hypothetical protein